MSRDFSPEPVEDRGHEHIQREQDRQCGEIAPAPSRQGAHQHEYPDIAGQESQSRGDQRRRACVIGLMLMQQCQQHRATQERSGIGHHPRLQSVPRRADAARCELAAQPAIVHTVLGLEHDHDIRQNGEGRDRERQPERRHVPTCHGFVVGEPRIEASDIDANEGQKRRATRACRSASSVPAASRDSSRRASRP